MVHQLSQRFTPAPLGICPQANNSQRLSLFIKPVRSGTPSRERLVLWKERTTREPDQLREACLVPFELGALK